MKQTETLIIGAGMAGLTAARVLWKRSRPIVVLDKGRGVGGRVATRRLGDARADHGAACFRLEGDGLALLDQDAWSALTLQPAPSELEAGAWNCAQGMNALAKAMAQDLPLALQQTVASLECKGGVWTCRSQEGQSWQSPQVLITSPLWQSAEFFSDTMPELKDQIQNLARRVAYEPQWTLLMRLAPDARPLGPVYHKKPHPDVANIYDQGRKGLPQAQGVLVIQASPTFSLVNLEADSTFVIAHLLDALRSVGWNVEGAEVQAHRWRYARIRHPLGKGFLNFDRIPGLCLAGDFCLGSTVHHAAESGRAAADFLARP